MTPEKLGTNSFRKAQGHHIFASINYVYQDSLQFTQQPEQNFSDIVWCSLKAMISTILSILLIRGDPNQL